MALPIEDEKQLSVGSGFQAIKKIRGLLNVIDVTDPPESWENREKQVVFVELEDVIILEMFNDEEAPNLTDNKFSFYIPYAKAGKTPTKGSIYNKCWFTSAKELGFKPSSRMGQYVTLEKQDRLLFPFYADESEMEGNTEVALDENGKRKTKVVDGIEKVLVNLYARTKEGIPNHFCFVEDETADSDNVKLEIRDLIMGLNESAALRKLVSNPKAKQFPEFRDKFKSGALLDELGLKWVEVDGKQVIGVKDEGSSS